MMTRLFQFLRATRRNTTRRSIHKASVLCEVACLEERVLLTAVSMTDYEQLLLELVNRGRSNPTAEANRYGIDLNQGLAAGTITTAAKQPLAPHQSLVNAAGLHSQDMLNRDYFSHTTLGTTNLAGHRAVAAGYPGSVNSVGENISWGGSTGPVDQLQQVFDRHESLFRSPGHRQNIMHTPYKEIGPGVRYGQYTNQGSTYNAGMVTEKFGARTVNPYITGVVYTDSDNDNFYDVGEAVRSGTITVTNTNTGAQFSEAIGNSGGYAISVPAGVYSVRAEYTVGGVPGVSSTIVTVTTTNVKVDFDATSPSVLNLTVSSSVVTINESGAVSSSTLTVTRNGDTGFPLTVTLSSSDTTELTVPVSVIIPAGSTSATFLASAVADTVIDGRQTARVTGSAGGYTAGSVSINVNDWTAPQLQLGPQITPDVRPTFTWTEVSNAATYEIWINNVTTGEAKVVNQTGITGNSFIPAVDLGIGTYYVWVRGFTSTGLASIWSPQAVIRTRPVPTVLDPGRTERSGSFAIEWNPVAGAASYDVWVDRLTSRTAQYLRNTNVPGTSLVVDDFDIGRYMVWVRARNSRGDLTPWSSQTLIVVNIPTTGLTVTGETLTSLSTFRWDAVPGAATYDVWVDNLTTKVNQFIRNTSVATNSLEMPTLAQGSYRAWVRARDVNGAFYTWSTQLNFVYRRAAQMLTPPNSPQVPRPLFTWTAVSGAVRYELVISDENLVPVMTESDLTSPFFTPATDLAAGSYRAWVRAIDSSDNSTNLSARISFSVADLDSDGLESSVDEGIELAFTAADEWLFQNSAAKTTSNLERSSQSTATARAAVPRRIEDASRDIVADEVIRMMAGGNQADIEFLPV
jgi:uncharacterized protein YkwD